MTPFGSDISPGDAGVPPGGSELSPANVDLLKLAKGRLEELLPSNWIPALMSQGIQVGLRLPSELLLVQRSIFFSLDGRVEAGIHGKRLERDHEFWATVRHVTLYRDSVEEFIGNVVDTVNRLRSFEVCRGVEGFRHLWKTEPKMEIDINPFQELRYTETCRSKSCKLLVPSLRKKRCGECSKIWNSLFHRNRTRSAVPDDVITPPKKKPHKFLSTSEKAKRLHRLSDDIEKLKHQNQRLRKKIEDLIDEDGVRVSDTLSSDIIKILSSKAAGKLTDFQKKFYRAAN